MEKLSIIFILLLPMCLFAQYNSVDINAGVLVNQTVYRSGIYNLKETNKGYMFVFAFKQPIFDKMFIRYGLRSTQTIQHINSVNPAIERFSFTTKGRWEEVFTTAHHTIWKERLYIEYGILASFLNKVDSMQEIDFTTKNVHKKGFNLKRKTYLTLGIGYQHTIKEVWQPFIQFDLQMTREKAFSNLIFEETNPFEFRSSFVLGCRYIIPKKSVIK